MNTYRFCTRSFVTKTAVAAVGIAAAVTSTVSAPASYGDTPPNELWALANQRHVSAGCPAYRHNPALSDEAGHRAMTMVTFPSGNIAGNGLTPTDSDLAAKGYFVTSWGEADFQNNNGHGSPQAAMDFWLANNTSQIFPNCNNQEMETGTYQVGNKFAAVLIAASPGGTAPQPPVVR